MSDYEPEQIEYALKVIAECDGSAQAAQDRLDAEYAEEKIAFNVPKSTLQDWKTITHAPKYEVIRARMNAGQEQETIAELKAMALRASKVAARAVTAAEARLPNAAAKEAAQIASAMAKTAETAANVAAKMEAGREEDPQSMAADFTEAINAIKSLSGVKVSAEIGLAGDDDDDEDMEVGDDDD